MKIIPSCNLILNSIITLQFSKPSMLKILSEIKSLNSNQKEIEKDDIDLDFKYKLEFKNVHFIYPNTQKKVLEDINLEIKKGDKIGIYGPSGSGKSTLIDLLIGLLNPSSGHIYLDNIKILDNKNYSWRRKIGYIPQNVLLFDDDVINNISLQNRPQNKNHEKLKNVLDDLKYQIF